jgi:sarcosine oxidase
MHDDGVVNASHRNSYDVIVIGLGAMGSNALASLARRGKRVLGIDRFDPPHSLGSSHGGSRVIRLSYFEHADYVPLLKHAYLGFDRLARESGVELRTENGLIMGGGPGNRVCAGMLSSAAKHDLNVEALDGGELMRRFTQFEVPRDWEAVFEARGGFVRPEATIRAALDVARQHGANILINTPVASWTSDGARVTVNCADERFAADSLVLSSGAWMPQLLGRDAPELRPTLETIVWIDDENDPNWDASRMPVWLFERGGMPEIYGVPAWSGMGSPRGLKIGLHGRGPTVDPMHSQRAVDQRIMEETLDAAAVHVRGARSRAVTACAHCLYTMSADTDFVVGLHPSHANIAVACGFSGHGFKFAPVIGEALADLALQRSTALPIGFLAPTRPDAAWTSPGTPSKSSGTPG